MAHKIIDTHVHIWDFQRARYKWLENDPTILNRSYSIDELTPQIGKVGVTNGVLVQAANNSEDTDMILEVAAKTEWIVGIVGWLPLTDPSQTYKIITQKYLNNKYFKGCRHLIHNEADPKWLLQRTVLESLNILAQKNITYDVVGVNEDHLKTALEVADKVPGLKMVFDHLNQPPISRGEKFGLWGSLMEEASFHPNLYAKISGMGTTTRNGKNWTKDDIKPYIVFAIEHFGTDRCFCGGDWPVALLAGSYENTWIVYQQIFSEELNEADRNKILSDNAINFYNLSFDL